MNDCCRFNVMDTYFFFLYSHFELISDFPWHFTYSQWSGWLLKSFSITSFFLRTLKTNHWGNNLSISNLRQTSCPCFFTNKIKWWNLLPCRSSRTASRTRDCFPLVEQNLARQTEEDSQEDCLPFFLDDDSNVLDRSPSLSSKRGSNIPNYRSSFDVDVDKGSCSSLNSMDITSRNTSVQKMEKTVSRHEDHHTSVGFLKDFMKATDEKPLKLSSKGFKFDNWRFCKLQLYTLILSFTFVLFFCMHSAVVDSLELADQDYVLVSGPPMEVSSSSASASGPRYSPCKSGSSPNTFVSHNKLSRPMPITSAVVKNNCGFGSLGSHSSAPSGTSQGSMDMVVDALEQPSTHSMTRISSLQSCASAITDLVNEKVIHINILCLNQNLYCIL